MKTRVCQPRKLAGGVILGRENETYYVIKCNALDRDTERRFKGELKNFVRSFSCVEEVKEFADQ